MIRTALFPCAHAALAEDRLLNADLAEDRLLMWRRIGGYKKKIKPVVEECPPPPETGGFFTNITDAAIFHPSNAFHCRSTCTNSDSFKLDANYSNSCGEVCHILDGCVGWVYNEEAKTCWFRNNMDAADWIKNPKCPGYTAGITYGRVAIYIDEEDPKKDRRVCEKNEYDNDVHWACCGKGKVDISDWIFGWKSEVSWNSAEYVCWKSKQKMCTQQDLLHDDSWSRGAGYKYWINEPACKLKDDQPEIPMNERRPSV